MKANGLNRSISQMFNDSNTFLLLYNFRQQFGFFERKTGYKYATVTQRNAETKVGTEKRQMYDDMYKYTPVPSENQPHQL